MRRRRRIPRTASSYEVSSSAGPPEDDRTLATEIVLGTFDGYGPSRWNTPDGHRPSKLEAQEKPATLIRALLFTPIEQFVGAGSSLERAMVPGGVSGCDRMSFDVDPLTVGRRYIFFLMPVSDSEGWMAGDLMMIRAWRSPRRGHGVDGVHGRRAAPGSEGLDRQRADTDARTMTCHELGSTRHA